MSKEIIEIEAGPRQASLRDLYYVFFRHKWKSLIFFMTVICVVTVATFTATEIYESEAKLLVKPGRESLAVDPTVPEGRIISISRGIEEQLNSELEILKSQVLIEQVVDAIGPREFIGKSDGASELVDPCALQDLRWKAVRKISKNLNIEALQKSSVIQITFESQSPELSKRTIEKLINFYLDHHIIAHQTGSSYGFFKELAENLQTELEKAENSIRTFKNNSKLGDLAEQRTVIIQQLGNLQQQALNAEAQLAASMAKVSSLEQSLDQMSETISIEEVTAQPNYYMDSARLRLLELRLHKEEMLAKYPENSLLIQNICDQIRQAETELESEDDTRTHYKTGINNSYQQLELTLLQERGQLASLQKQKEVLNEQIANIQVELKNLNDSEIKLAQLERHRIITEQSYYNYVDKLKETQTAQALEQKKLSNIAVIQPATLPRLPIKPKKILNLLLGLCLGVFGGIGLSFFFEYLDHTIKTPEEVQERLQLPTLASIPRIRANRSFLTAKWRKKAKPSDIVNKASAPWNMPANLKEHYEPLMERLLMHNTSHAETPRTLAIMGCHRGGGTSTVAANLATILANRGENILLVDADISHPSVHRFFQTKLSPGLADILANGKSNSDTISPSPVHNLHILPAGFKNSNLSEMLISNEFTELLNSLKNRYSFVLIDMQAISETSSAIRLASLCDGVILVVEAERLRWEVALRTKEQLIDSNANILGVVINKRQFHIPNWLYRTL